MGKTRFQRLLRPPAPQFLPAPAATPAPFVRPPAAELSWRSASLGCARLALAGLHGARLRSAPLLSPPPRSARLLSTRLLLARLGSARLDSARLRLGARRQKPGLLDRPLPLSSSGRRSCARPGLGARRPGFLSSGVRGRAQHPCFRDARTQTRRRAVGSWSLLELRGDQGWQRGCDRRLPLSALLVAPPCRSPVA